MTSRRAPIGGQDEDGQILIAVLIFIVVISVVVGVILSFAETDFNLTKETRKQRQEIYAADGAIDAAIDYYHRQSATSASRCPDSSWAPPEVNSVTSVTISCMADGSNAALPTNVPSSPIITRGSADAADGVNVNGGALLPARGGNIYSEGRISVSAGALLYDPIDVGATGSAPTIRALGSCSPAPPDSVYNPQPTCNATYNSATDPPADATVFTGNSLGNGAVVSPYPTATAVPACPGNGSAITLDPGRYTDFTGLKALTTSCSSTVIWLKPPSGGSPGIFQFDFGDQWTIGNGQLLLGGTPTGSIDTSFSRAVGERCDDDAQGVQLVFSGESRINLSGGGVGGGGAMEICPPLFSDTTTQRVAVWGPMTVGSVSTTVPFVAPTPTSNGNPKYAPTAGAVTAGDLIVATATVNSNKSAKLDAEFTVPVIPAGATVTKVEVAITHSESGVSPFPAGWTLKADVSGTGASTTITPALSTSSTTLTTDVTSTFNTAAKLAGMEVSYTAAASNIAPNGFVSNLDGVTVAVTYSTASVTAFAGQSGCIISAAAGNCPVLQTTGNSTMTLKGTIYAPLSFVDIALNNASFQVFGRGVVVRRLDTNITPSVDCPIPPPNDEDHNKCFAFQLPRNKAAGDTAVFVATVNGRVRARARVKFSTTSPPQIRNWSNTNEAA